MKKIAIVGILCGVAGVLGAQENPGIAFSAGAGFTTPVSSFSSNLDTGWNVRAGIGYNFVPWFGVMTNFGYDSMGVNNTTLSNLGYGGGNVNVFSATLDPIVHLTPKHHFDAYVTGGGGYFREEDRFTDVGTATGIVGNPFFGYYPVQYGTNIVVSDYSVNKPGLDGGMGIAFGSKWGGRFFAEARFVRIFTGPYHTDYIPVTFGFRK